MTRELLQQFENALRRRNPVLCKRLRRGLPEARIRKKLETAGITGNVEPIVQLFSWKNGTSRDLSLTLAETSPFPESVYIFESLSTMLIYFEGLKEAAIYHPLFSDIAGRYFPLFWDGSNDCMAVDLDPAQHGRIVLLVTQLESPVMQAYGTLDEFLADAIRANNEDDQLACFSQGLRPERMERICTYCREPLSAVQKLLETEHGAAICNRCVALCYEAMRRAGADLTVPTDPGMRLDWLTLR